MPSEFETLLRAIEQDTNWLSNVDVERALTTIIAAHESALIQARDYDLKTLYMQVMGSHQTTYKGLKKEIYQLIEARRAELKTKQGSKPSS